MGGSATINITFFIYLVALILLGYMAHSKVKSAASFTEEYWVGSRSFGPWLVAFTWATAWTSGGSFIGTPAYYYTYGWTALLWQAAAGLLGILGLISIGRRVANISRDSNCLTLPDLFVDRYESKNIGLLAALIILIFGSAYMVSQFVAAARILEVTLNIPYVWGIVIFAVIVGLYTSIGGVRGVAYTDILQGLLMVGGAMAIVVVIVAKAGGLAAISNSLLSQDPNLMVPPGPKNWLPFPMAISMFFVLGVAVMAQPHVLVRLFTVKDVKSVQRAGVVVSVVTFTWFICLFLTSIAGRVLMPNIEVADQALPLVVITHAPKFLAGIMLAAPFAAVMSTVDSLLLSVSGAAIRDIYQRNINPNVDEKVIKKLSYATTFIVGLVVLLLSLNPPAFLQAIVIFAISGFAASFTMPIIMGLFWKGATAMGGMVSMVGGFLTLIVLYAFKIPRPLGFDPLIWGMLVSMVLMVAVSKVTPTASDDVNERYFGFTRSAVKK